MPSKSIQKMILPTLFPAAITFSAIGCLTSAFGMDVGDAWILALCFLSMSLLWGIAQHFRFGIAILVCAICLVGYFYRETLLLSLEKMLWWITRHYDAVWNCGVIRWTDTDLISVSLFPIILLLGCLAILPSSLSMHQRGWAILSLLPSFVVIAACCIVEHTQPDIIYIVLFAASAVLLTMTQLTRRHSATQADRLSLLLLIPVLLFSTFPLTVAMANPQAEKAQLVWDQILALFTATEENSPIVSPKPTTGTILDLSTIGPRILPNDQAMTVTANHTGILYLRGRAYDTYTGTTWMAVSNATDYGGWPTDGMTAKGEITIKTQKQSFRYTPYYVQQEKWTKKLIGGAYDNPNKKATYSFTWMVADENSVPKITPLTDVGSDMTTDLPRSTKQALKIMVNSLLRNAPEDVQTRANILADYVRNSAKYDLNTATMSEDADDFVVWFLQEADSGYCVHYASATAVLLRLAGIPARYVSGYITYTIPGVAVPVGEKQAHAWVEYYHPELGWTVLDATPDAESIPDIPTAPTEETTLPTEETTQPSQETKPPRETTEPTQPPSLARPQNTAPTTATNPQTEKSTWYLSVLWVILALAAVFLQYGLRLRLRQRWLNVADPKRSLLRHWRYARFLATISRKKLPEELHFLAEKATFSQHAPQPEEIRQFTLWLRKTQAQLLQKPWLIRILLQMLLAI